MNLPRIALNVTSKMYAKMEALGNKVIVSITGNANYTTPSPSLAELQLAITALSNARTQHGTPSNHGSTADTTDLEQKGRSMFLMLKAMLQYCSNTAELEYGTNYGEMESVLATSGFDLVKSRVPASVLETVADLRIFTDRSLNKNQAKIRWKRPANTSSPQDVDGYMVFVGTTPEFTAAKQVATVTKTTYQYDNSSPSAVTVYVWICGFNTAGPGAISGMLTVSVWSL